MEIDQGQRVPPKIKDSKNLAETLDKEDCRTQITTKNSRSKYQVGKPSGQEVLNKCFKKTPLTALLSTPKNYLKAMVPMLNDQLS